MTKVVSSWKKEKGCIVESRNDQCGWNDRGQCNLKIRQIDRSKKRWNDDDDAEDAEDDNENEDDNDNDDRKEERKEEEKEDAVIALWTRTLQSLDEEKKGRKEEIKIWSSHQKCVCVFEMPPIWYEQTNILKKKTEKGAK